MDLMRLRRNVRRGAGRFKRFLFPTPEVAAWNKARREAEGVPRFTGGRIRLMSYELDYVDLLTLCPQWHDLFVRETLEVALPQRPRILDCGANIGLSTLYFKSRHPGARITAYEADPAIARVLRANLDRNGAGDVEVVRAAVWNASGTVEFCAEGADSGAVASLATGLEGKPVRVPSIRLRELLEREEVDLLKLDVEGAEDVVLEDCREQLRNVRAILLDLHELDPANRRTTRVLGTLDSAGFVWNMDELTALPWRKPTASMNGPFPGTHLCWAALVRAWKRDLTEEP